MRGLGLGVKGQELGVGFIVSGSGFRVETLGKTYASGTSSAVRPQGVACP